MALKAKNPITDALKNWIKNNFASTNHNHGDIFDARPDWSRCTEYQLHYDRIATKGNIYKINADGYLFFTDTQQSHHDGGGNTRDADGAIVAATAIEPLMRNNIDVTFDLWRLHAAEYEGSVNHANGLYAVDKSHPWFLRYHTRDNDILIWKMYFIPCKSQPTCDYLTLQYCPGNVATGAMYHSEFNGNPANTILPQNGYIINGEFPLNNTEHKYYAKVIDTITLVNGVKVPRYTYKYSVTGAATSGFSRYTWFKPPVDESGQSYPELREVQGLEEVWVVNCEDRWQVIFLRSYQDAPGTTYTKGDGTFSWVSECHYETQRLIDGVWTSEVTPWAASVRDENNVLHYSEYYTRSQSSNYIIEPGITARTFDYQKRYYETEFSEIIIQPQTQSISRFATLLSALTRRNTTWKKVIDCRATPTLFPATNGTSPFELDTTTGFVKPKDTINTETIVYDGFNHSNTRYLGTIMSFGEHLFKAME